MNSTLLPVSLLTWSLALVPILVLSVLLIKYRWTGQQAGASGLFVAGIIAYFFFETPLSTLAVAGGKGVWDALFILYVVWPALLLYQIMIYAGGYDALRRGIMKFSRNEVFLVVAIGWVFTSFLQGIDGFGTPIVVCAPLLVAIGMRPVYAVAIPIIAHIWAKFYGTLGVGWLATTQVVALADPVGAAFDSALLILPQTFLGGFFIVWMYGRWAAVKHALPLIIVISLVQGVGQLWMSVVDPILAAFLPATAAMLVLLLMAKWRRYAEPAHGITERPAMQAHMLEDDGLAPNMSMLTAFMPYVLLTVLALASSFIEPISVLLNSYSIGLHFPAVQTGYGVIRGLAEPYSSLRPFSHPGAYILIAAMVTWIIYTRLGLFKRWQTRQTEPMPSIMDGLMANAVPASVPIVAFLVMARIMDHSGQNEVLALGVAAIAPAYVFAFMANGIGILGAFTTSSSTSSQVLFSDLQVKLAHINGLPENVIIAAQSAGGGIGNAIAPANVVLGASTANAQGQEGEIMRKTLPWTIVAFLMTGVLTVLLALFR